MIRMQTKKVNVVDYDPIWAENFLQIKNELSEALGESALSIEHIGSTSVVGLSAKPIIDIDVVINSVDELDTVIQKLDVIGYEFEGDLGIEDRYAFKYKDKEHLQKHHLYVCSKTSIELHRHIVFRDYLRTHPNDVILYGNIKKEAAKLYPNDIEKYIQYKSGCISELYKKCGLE